LNSTLYYRIDSIIKSWAQKAENRLKAILGIFGLALGLVRRVQIAAVQSVALYRAEL
jgi:hypothetical protein